MAVIKVHHLTGLGPAGSLGLEVCVYDLKRFALTFLVEVAGPRYAQEQAGHRSSHPTMEIYARVSDEGRKTARKRVDQAIMGKRRNGRRSPAREYVRV